MILLLWIVKATARRRQQRSQKKRKRNCDITGSGKELGDAVKPTEQNLALEDDGLLAKGTAPANGNMSFEEVLAKYAYEGNEGLLNFRQQKTLKPQVFCPHLSKTVNDRRRNGEDENKMTNEEIGIYTQVKNKEHQLPIRSTDEKLHCKASVEVLNVRASAGQQDGWNERELKKIKHLKPCKRAGTRVLHPLRKPLRNRRNSKIAGGNFRR